MKIFASRCIFTLLVVALAQAQAEAKRPAPPAIPVKAATLGLPRLDARANPGALSRLDAGKFEIDALHVPAGAAGLRKAQQRNITYLALDPSTEWSRPLRGNPHDVTFVSFNLHASYATVIEAGGAWLSVLPSDTPGRATLMAGKPEAGGGLMWEKVGIDCPLDHFGGKELAVLPILTVRIDPAAGTWDLYSGVRQVAHALPLANSAEKGAPRKLTLQAGPAGVWLNAVAVCDENPLFADNNANGIDDAYELNKKGALLSANAPAAERKALAFEWQRAQRVKLPAPPMAVRPLPDRLIAKIAEKEK